jgi:hypothetical protein
VIKQIFERCVDFGLISENRNPARKLKCEKNSYAVKDIRPLAQIEKTLSALGGHNALVKQIIDDPSYRLGETQTNWQTAFTAHPEWQRAICGDLLDDETLNETQRTRKIRARVAYYAKRGKAGTEDYGQAQHVRDLVEGLASPAYASEKHAG